MSTIRARGGRAAHSQPVRWLARAGIGARAAVYAVVGVLALKLALGDGGKTTDQQGAMKTVAQGSFGKVLLVLLAVGLFGYALWRLIRAVRGHGIESGGRDDAKDRVDSAVSAVAYGLLCFTAVGLLVGSGSGSGGGGGPDQATGGVLGWPGGQVLVALGGLIVIGVGVQQAVKGVKRSFCEQADTSRMDDRVEHAYTVAGVAGHLARAVVFALIGAFAIKAAIEFDPDDAVGLDGALAAVAQSPGGTVALGVVAAGLLCFAAYAVLDARYRRI